ncbi:MAG: cupin domain-containing protein [Cyanobacteriota bacterium]|nr:cupin domain-containing protein [Cyanobacteriota bacterium]
MHKMILVKHEIMKKLLVIIFALALTLLFLNIYSKVFPVSAREIQPRGASIGFISDQDLVKFPDATDSTISSLKYSGSSSSSPASLRFACDPRSLGISHYDGGTIAYCKKKDLEVSDTDSAIIEIKPGAARAPHWHDTWEQQILISGKAKTYLIDGKGQIHEEVLTQGMVALLPAGMTHWTETIGDQAAVISLLFPAGFKTFELGDSMIQVSMNDKSCTQVRKASCGAKRKSLILLIKDGLI